MKPLATLNAEQHGTGTLRLELIQQSVDELSLARMPYADVRVHDEIVETLSARIRRVVEGRVANTVQGPRSKVVRADPLVASGQGLFDEILPLQQHDVRFIREPLCDLRTALLVATDIPEIPWELLHDGSGFLGLRYEMGRSLRARGPEWRPPRKNGDWQCLIIANPTGDLPTTGTEATAVRESLEAKGIACDYLSEHEATFDNVLDLLNSSHYDIVHYSGHIGREHDSREFGFVLHDSQYFTASAIKTHVRTPAIAFLNGCNSGEVVQGLTEAFLATGAQMVIGSLFETPSRGAAAFAQRFYEDFLRGVSAGESMRQARLHVKDLENCGPAWACFVMYGDPRFSLDLKTDELDAWLANAGFDRAEFDASAVRVLRQALAYGAIARGVNSAVLFAALLEGTEPFLRKQLELHQVLELLEGAFKSALKADEKDPVATSAGELSTQVKSGGELEPSPHVLEILRRAGATCRARGLVKTTELGLVSGFAREAAGGAWTILRRLHVRPADLDPWQDAPARKKICGVGGFAPSMCSEGVWEILLSAAAKGAGAGVEGVSAIHLFQAMAQRQSGPLHAALHRLGLAALAGSGVTSDRQDSPVYESTGEQVLCSRNVADILARAQTAAAVEMRVVEETDLLVAFVENGGGGAGNWMVQQGAPLRIFTSNLFLDGGVLDTGRFEESGQKVIDEAIEFARQRHYSVIGRRHLLYGLLSASDYFAEELRKQDRDADLLAEELYVHLPLARQGCGNAMLRWSSFSADLLKVLCEAETLAAREGCQAISDKHLLHAWCLDGGGEARQFLIQRGVRVRKFFKEE